jgi:hypothetical protein
MDIRRNGRCDANRNAAIRTTEEPKGRRANFQKIIRFAVFLPLARVSDSCGLSRRSVKLERSGFLFPPLYGDARLAKQAPGEFVGVRVPVDDAGDARVDDILVQMTQGWWVQ